MNLLRDAGDGGLAGVMPHPPASQAGAATPGLQSPTSLPTGGSFFGTSGSMTLPEWFAPGSVGGATILNQDKFPVPENKSSSAATNKGK
jgi:hypothetical protein